MSPKKLTNAQKKAIAKSKGAKKVAKINVVVTTKNGRELRARYGAN